MADETAVNDQITDSITQPNVEVLGSAPAMALGHLFQTMSQSTGLSIQNAAASQQRAATLGQASIIQGTNLLYTLDTAADSVATSKANMSDLPTALLSLLTASKAAP